GASVREIGVVAAAYPVVWGAGQLLTGWLSDHTGRKPLITAGMLVQAGALGLLVVGDGAFAPSLAAALLLGAGTAMVYPTLLAAVSDASQPRDRARVVGVYRFWRDFGFVLGALIAGIGADATSTQTAILIVALLTGASGLFVAAAACASSAGAATPWAPGRLAPGERVLGLGSGAGTDSLIAAQMVREHGHVTGIDMTPEMLAKARAAAAEMDAANVEFVESEAEQLPFPDASFDVVISNGVIDLIPDKDAVFAEIFRVLTPGGRIQIAHVTIQNPVSAEGRRNIDLWTG